MIVLAIETCLGACSSAVVNGQQVLAVRSDPMARGHQERLAPLVQAVMAEAGLHFPQLERVGVTVGPGSFTGLRVGLAFAKGLGAALGIQVAGVGTLEALAEPFAGRTLAVIDARRDQVYLQPFEGAPLAPPQVAPLDQALALAAKLAPTTLVGPGAGLLAAAAPGARIAATDFADPAAVARLAAGSQVREARPIYLRAPDARLPSA